MSAQVLLALLTLPLALAAPDFSTLTAEQFAQKLANCDLVPCTISDAVYTGANAASGVATLPEDHYVSTTFGGDDEALALTTGSLITAEKDENSEPSQTTPTFTPGDQDLADLLGVSVSTLLDASSVEFKLSYAASGELAFEFIFGSEEYLESKGSPFNDFFAFFVDGQNVAVLADGTVISINTVNDETNSEFFVNNDFENGTPTPFNVEYDGLTVKMQTKPFAVTAGVTYTVKLVIADAADRQLDSAVYLRMNSLRLRLPGCGDGDVDPARETCDGGECCFFDCTLDTESTGCEILCLDGITDSTELVCCAGSCSACSGCACEEGPQCCPRVIGESEVRCMFSSDVECLLGDFVPSDDIGVESC